MVLLLGFMQAAAQDIIINEEIYSQNFNGSARGDLYNFDNDGDFDLVTGVDNTTSQPQIRIFDLGSGSSTVIATASVNDVFISADFIDTDGDGDLDLLIVKKLFSDQSEILVAEQTGVGSGTFNTPVLIEQVPLIVSYVVIVDFDKDNLRDVIFAAHDPVNSDILWMKNTGSGFSVASPLLQNLPEEVNAMLPLEIDGTGNMDFVISMSDVHTAVYLASGTTLSQSQVIENFDADGIVFVENMLFLSLDQPGKIRRYQKSGTNFGVGQDVASSSDPYALVIADFSGDGLYDLAYTDLVCDCMRILYQNGAGSFDLVHEVPIGTGNSTPLYLYAADLDQDSQNTVEVIAQASGHSTIQLSTLWLDTDGDGVPNVNDTDDDDDGYLDVDEIACGSDPLDGSSVPDDFDGDFIPDCVDDDVDGDGVLNDDDACPFTPLGTPVGLDGCPELGIDEFALASTSFYPNPVTDRLYIDAPEGVSITGVEGYNLLGQKILEVSGQPESIDFSVYPVGMYIVNVLFDNGHVSQGRIIKK